MDDCRSGLHRRVRVPRPEDAVKFGPVSDPSSAILSGVTRYGEYVHFFAWRPQQTGMPIELRFFATFREAVGTKTITREYDATTVGDALVALESEFDGLTGQILDDGAVQPQVNVLLDGRDVTHEQGIDTPIEPDDTLSIFPPVAGGTGPDA